jgi:hypothetical protein
MNAHRSKRWVSSCWAAGLLFASSCVIEGTDGASAVQKASSAEEPWGYSMVQAHLLPAASPAVKVCIIGSGMDPPEHHPDFAGVGITGNQFADNRGVSTPWDSGSAQGTRVAGIVAAAADGQGIVGVARGVSLHIVKVNHGWTVWPTQVIEAIQDCVAEGARVIHLDIDREVFKDRDEPIDKYPWEPLHDDLFPLEKQAINDAYAANVLLVSDVRLDLESLGDPDYTPMPAGYRNVIAVGSVDEDRLWIHAYSSPRFVMELAAPGVGIRSTAGGAHDITASPALAAAHVTGVAALLVSAFPDATSAEIRAALQTTALDLNTTYQGTECRTLSSPPARDIYFGFGLVRAQAACYALGGSPALCGAAATSPAAPSCSDPAPAPDAAPAPEPDAQPAPDAPPATTCSTQGTSCSTDAECCSNLCKLKTKASSTKTCEQPKGGK